MIPRRYAPPQPQEPLRAARFSTMVVADLLKFAGLCGVIALGTAILKFMGVM